MRTRIVSSIGVVFVGLMATLVGGPLFALLSIALGIAGYREFLGLSFRIAPPATSSVASVGVCIVAAFSLAGLLDVQVAGLYLVTSLAVLAPLTMLLAHSVRPGAVWNWAIVSVGSLYLGLPMFAAVALRSLPGPVNAAWLTDLSEGLTLGWEPAPRGLAWALTVIVVTWVGDSAAYLIGRSYGRDKLAPRLSPNKTVKGAVAGLIASAGIGGLSFVVYGLGTWWVGAVTGLLLGIAGQLGDLAESLFKRQAGVKDSGALIPGHGGVLDRIDALLFAFPVGYVIASSLDWLAPV